MVTRRGSASRNGGCCDGGDPGGASIVRVHDVAFMKKVDAMADEIAGLREQT